MGLSWTHTAIGWTELSSEWPGRWETNLDTNELNRSQLNGMLETISAGLGWKEPGGTELNQVKSRWSVQIDFHPLPVICLFLP